MFAFDLKYEWFSSLNMHQIKNIRKQIPRAAFIVLSESRAFCSLQTTEVPPGPWNEDGVQLMNPEAADTPQHSQGHPITFTAPSSFVPRLLLNQNTVFQVHRLHLEADGCWQRGCPSSKGFIWWQRMSRCDWRSLNIFFKILSAAAGKSMIPAWTKSC